MKEEEEEVECAAGVGERVRSEKRVMWA